MLSLVTVMAAFSFCQITRASGVSIPAPSNQRIEVTHGGNCINYLWNACVPPKSCLTTLSAKKESSSGLAITSIQGPFLPAVTLDNSSYAFCIYNVESSINSSCCKYRGSGVIEGLRLSDYDYISFQTKTCSNTSSSMGCVTQTGWKKFIMPLKNPCFLNKPCQNNGQCSPGVNEYNCSCSYDWHDKNCDVPRGYAKIAKKCLDYQNKTEELLNKTVGECSRRCYSLYRCKSFEFTKQPSGNHGNCTLRDSSSKSHSLVTCAADYFELFEPTKNPNAAAIITTSGHGLLITLLVAVLMQW